MVYLFLCPASFEPCSVDQRCPFLFYIGCQSVTMHTNRYVIKEEDYQRPGSSFLGYCEYGSKAEQNAAYQNNLQAFKGREFSVKQLKRMKYRAQYLATEHWRRTRMQALVHANCMCERCGRGEDEVILDVHHKPGHYFLGEEQPDDLVVLCRECHELEHEEAAA